MVPESGRSHSRRITLTLLAVVLAAGVLVGSWLVAGGEQTVTETVNQPASGGIAPKALEVPADAVEEATEGLTGEAAETIPRVAPDSADHTGARIEQPEGVSVDELEENLSDQAENIETEQALPTAGASAGFKGCRTQFVRNQSGRRGVRPTVQVLHYTVSPNRLGWSDVDAITAFFNRSSSQASSHFIIDAEGNCAYIVPIEAKAWTQAGGNPWAVSYEIIATGREPVYLGPRGYARLRSVALQVSRRTGIPMRTGRISGCSPSRSGIVQHAHGGRCWGGHHDIGPFGFDQVVAKMTAGGNLARERRRRHVSAHKELKRRNCAAPARTRSERCRFLHRRLAALHKIGIKF